jgi:hypothetical protein
VKGAVRTETNAKWYVDIEVNRPFRWSGGLYAPCVLKGKITPGFLPHEPCDKGIYQHDTMLPEVAIEIENKADEDTEDDTGGDGEIEAHAWFGYPDVTREPA